MGNTLQQQTHPRQPTPYPAHLQQHPMHPNPMHPNPMHPNPMHPPTDPNPSAIPNQFYKLTSQSMRFGQVERVRSRNMSADLRNKFVFILSMKQSEEFVKVECSVVSSYADHVSLKFPVLIPGGIVVDARHPPIIDLHDIQSDTQIHHKLILHDPYNQTPTPTPFPTSPMSQPQAITVKAYPFTNYTDHIFKKGLYEAHLYQLIDGFNNKVQGTLLRDFFVIDKGKCKAVVFVYGAYWYSLEDVIRYRKQAHLPYTKQQQQYIILQILKKYHTLYLNNILHRDLRPGKIYLADSTPISSQSLNYELLNLQTCRRITEQQQYRPDQLMLSVCGVPQSASEEVRVLHGGGNRVGVYDGIYNDRIGLVGVVVGVVTLGDGHYGWGVGEYLRFKSKIPAVDQLIKQLLDRNALFQNIYRQFLQKTKQIHITHTGILQSDKKICQSNLPTFLKQLHASRIEQSTTELLLTLHQRELFTARFDRMMSKNYSENNYLLNIAILDRIGRYYQDIGTGMQDNMYYLEELRLLLQLAEDQRGRGFDTGHVVGRANQVYYGRMGGKVGGRGGGRGGYGVGAECQVFVRVENGYLAFYRGDVASAQKYINQTLIQHGASKTSLPFDVQLKLMKAKGVIQSHVNGEDSGNIYFQKGLEISNSIQNFTTHVQMLQSRSDFQYLLAKNIINKIMKNRAQIGFDLLKTECAKAQSLLSSAREIKRDIPTHNSLPLAKVYDTYGDLLQVKEDYQGAIDNYSRAYRLMISSAAPISDSQKVRILNKMYKHYQNHSQNYLQQQKIRAQLRTYQTNQMDLSVQNKDRKYFKKIRYMKSKNSLLSKPTNANELYKNSIMEVEENFQDEDLPVRPGDGIRKSPSLTNALKFGNTPVIGLDNMIINRNLNNSQNINMNQNNLIANESPQKLALQSSLGDSIKEMLARGNMNNPNMPPPGPNIVPNQGPFPNPNVQRLDSKASLQSSLGDSIKEMLGRGNMNNPNMQLPGPGPNIPPGPNIIPNTGPLPNPNVQRLNSKASLQSSLGDSIKQMLARGNNPNVPPLDPNFPPGPNIAPNLVSFGNPNVRRLDSKASLQSSLGDSIKEMLGRGNMNNPNIPPPDQNFPPGPGPNIVPNPNPFPNPNVQRLDSKASLQSSLSDSIKQMLARGNMNNPNIINNPNIPPYDPNYPPQPNIDRNTAAFGNPNVQRLNSKASLQSSLGDSIKEMLANGNNPNMPPPNISFNPNINQPPNAF